MKKIHYKLGCLINELNVIFGILDFIGKGLRIITPLVPADIYYKLLLVSAGIRKAIIITGEAIKNTKMSLQQPKMAFFEPEERRK